MQWLAKFIYFKILSWRLIGNTNFSKETIKKAIIIIAPHTSNQDFFICALMRTVVNLKSSFLAKKSLFAFPQGWLLRKMGGIPVDRTLKENKVATVSKLFAEKSEFRVAIAPEGTRKKVSQWRTGFYYMAREARVPIIMLSLDYENKQGKISEPFYPTENLTADFNVMHDFFKNVKRKRA